MASRCECGGCGEVFRGVTAFDLHQAWKQDGAFLGCLAPGARGLVRSSSGAWHFPADARAQDRFARLRAERELARTGTRLTAVSGGEPGGDGLAG